MTPTADVSAGVRSVASRRGAAATTMMAKNVRLSEKSRQKLVEGINIVANAVKVTLGPKVRGTIGSAVGGFKLIARPCAGSRAVGPLGVGPGQGPGPVLDMATDMTKAGLSLRYHLLTHIHPSTTNQ